MVSTKCPPAFSAGEDATVSYLLSRILSGGRICRATELAACLPRWFSDLKENKPIAPGSPELLCRLTLPFGTPSILEQIESLQIPDSLTDRQRWMAKLRILMDNKAHERLLQKLESLQDQQISFEALCEQENEDCTDDYLVADPKRTLQFDYDMRDVMIRGDKNAMRKNHEVFYVTGSVAWTVRSPYWNVALATDDEGNRYLSDDVLDEVLPKWRQILTGETIPTPKYGVVDSFRLWLASEEKKASDLGKSWPPSTPINTASASRLGFVTPEPYSRLRASDASRLSPFQSPQKVTGSEQTELLREILTQIKELKTIVGQILESKQELEITENQIHGSLPRYPPIPLAMQPPAPPAMQPNYFLRQSQLSGPQYQLEPDWQQRWNSQYQGPTTMPGPGPSSARHL
ncbi:hypothetical protein N7517_001798 [Penicillium concentricum]|uniref:Uncharacterized protein n=1 Tax=Penicillium concentricum TaxID=293559 RepID=A0A9W9SSN3_9EURO|nr:uncharacterized protein N7517_001798 [Penicillium concentricum]KAJ5383887.1 hypothetical protein N7517_001798 [Penicillium concentricum]